MKTINLSDKDFERLVQLSKEHDEIYGNENETVWSFDDVENLRQIGTDFICLFSMYLK